VVPAGTPAPDYRQESAAAMKQFAADPELQKRFLVAGRAASILISTAGGVPVVYAAKEAGRLWKDGRCAVGGEGGLTRKSLRCVE